MNVINHCIVWLKLPFFILSLSAHVASIMFLVHHNIYISANIDSKKHNKNGANNVDSFSFSTAGALVINLARCVLPNKTKQMKIICRMQFIKN